MKVLSEYYFMMKELQEERKEILNKHNLKFKISYDVIDKKTGQRIHDADPKIYPELYSKIRCIECKRNEIKNIKNDIKNRNIELGLRKTITEYDIFQK
jgi:hypothetical protein